MWLKSIPGPGLRVYDHGLLLSLLLLGYTRPFLSETSAVASCFRGVGAGAGAPFTCTASLDKTRYPPRPKPPPDEDITEAYLKGSGPGGQKINKTNSAVQLKHIPTGIVVKCQETRSREQNRKLARQHLAEKIDDLLNGDNSRSAVMARILAKKKASALKKSRRKHRKGTDGEGDEEGEEDDADEVDQDDGQDEGRIIDEGAKKQGKAD